MDNPYVFDADVAELLREARRMHGGDGMLRRYATRQGWHRPDGRSADDVLVDAAWFVVADGRDWHDVLRAAS